MSDVEDHRELPDFLGKETLARICIDLARERAREMRKGNTQRVVRIDALHEYYWESLRRATDQCEAHLLLYNAE